MIVRGEAATSNFNNNRDRAIHPFADGNGRTGRLINLLYLVDQGLLDVPVLYLSGYILENRQLYYAGLRAVTEDKEWEPWIILIVEGIRRAAVATLVKVESIIKAMIETEQLIRDKSRGMYSKELVNCVYALPYCKVQFLIDADIAGRQTASKYLQQLVTIGVLREQKIGRDKYFINPRLLEITMGANFQYKQRN